MGKPQADVEASTLYHHLRGLPGRLGGTVACRAAVLRFVSFVALALHAAGATADALSVRIAVPAPLNGPLAPVGRSMLAAAVLVAADINAAHGAVRVEVEMLDDPCSSADATRAAAAHAAAKYDVVIGYPCRATAQAAALAFAKVAKITIATAPVIPPFGLAQSGPTVFRMAVAERSLGHHIGHVLAASDPAARIAIVRDKTQQAIGLAQSVEAGLRAAGRVVHATEVFTGGDKAFAPLVARLKALGVTHVALLAFPVEGGLIAAELAAALPGIDIIGPDFLATSDTPLIAGAAAGRLRVVLPSADPLGAGQAGRDLMKRIAALKAERNDGTGKDGTGKDGIGEDGTGNGGQAALLVAAAIEAYVDAVRRAGSTDPIAVATSLRAPTEQALRYGAGAFDARGHRTAPYWAQFRWTGDGTLTQVP